MNVPLDPPAWSAEARLSSQLWFGMDAATRWLIIDRWGLDFALHVEYTFMRKHQLTHFIDGATKLGIVDLPHPQLCAQYHVLSNQLGGLDMAYHDEGDRAWVFYLPPEAFGGSPLLPTPAVPAVSAQFYIENFRAWHANNGVLLGNPRLRFVATDLIFAGGPYNAGYWEEADHDLSVDERLILKVGEIKGHPGPPPALGSNVWPQARRDSALRKYNAEYALGGLAHIASFKGLDEASRIAEDSHRNTFLSWARPLMFELKPTGNTPQRLAALFRRCFEAIEDEFTEETSGESVLLHHTRTRLKVPQYQWNTPPRKIEEAFARAWSVISRAVGDEVRVSVEQSLSEGADHTVWRFTSA